MQSVLGFDGVENKKRSEAIVSTTRKSAKTIQQTGISAIISMSVLTNINLHVHETLRCVIASQAQMLFDSVRWKYVVLGQHLIGHKVVGSAKQVVFYVLLAVFSQTSQMSILLIWIRLQDDIQGLFAQAVRSHCAKHCHLHYTVPLLLDGNFATVKDQGNQ
jgi:hypothetical protein